MKLKLFKILTLALALCMLVTSFVSCANDDEETTETTGAIETQAEEIYSFPDSISLSDSELNILNFDQYYNAIVNIDTDDTSTKVTEAIYSRNRGFEDTYGIKVNEMTEQFVSRTESFNALTNKITTASLAGDDIYDILYVSLHDQASLLTSGILKNLAEVSTLQLDAEWWDKEISDSYILADGKTYVASSPLNVMPYEMSWVILYNKGMANELKIPSLYQTVRDGKWTLEEMYKTITTYGVIAANADGSYEYAVDGSARYGIAVHSAGPSHLLVGCNIGFIQTKDDPDVPYKYGCSDADAFSRASETLAKLFDKSAGVAIGNDYEDDVVNHPEGYVPVFGSGDALFLNCELKSGMTLKKKIVTNVEYGILPNPKLSTDQDAYYTDMANSTMMFAIPAICDEAEAVGTCADVLSYLSYRDLMPVYYGEYVSYRNANDPESLEMLENYIMPGRSRDKGIVYGWTNDLISTYNGIIYKGTSNGGVTLANILSVYAKTINGEIKSFYGK